jgi:hypothetical protein
MNHETPPSFIPEKLAWSFDDAAEWSKDHHSSTSQEDRKFGRVDFLRSNPFAILLPFLCKKNPEMAVFVPPNHGRRH